MPRRDWGRSWAWAEERRVEWKLKIFESKPVLSLPYFLKGGSFWHEIWTHYRGKWGLSGEIKISPSGPFFGLKSQDFPLGTLKPLPAGWKREGKIGQLPLSSCVDREMWTSVTELKMFPPYLTNVQVWQMWHFGNVPEWTNVVKKEWKWMCECFRTREGIVEEHSRNIGIRISVWSIRE